MRRHEEAVVAIGSRLAGEPSGDVHHEVPTRGGVHHEPVGRHGHNHGAGSRRAGAIHIHERRRRGRSAVGAGSEVPARSADTGDVHGQRDGVGGHAVRQRHLHARPWRERCAAAGVQQSVGRERLEPAGRGRCGGDEHAEQVHHQWHRGGGAEIDGPIVAQQHHGTVAHRAERRHVEDGRGRHIAAGRPHLHVAGGSGRGRRDGQHRRGRALRHAVQLGQVHAHRAIVEDLAAADGLPRVGDAPGRHGHVGGGATSGLCRGGGGDGGARQCGDRCGDGERRRREPRDRRQPRPGAAPPCSHSGERSAIRIGGQVSLRDGGHYWQIG